MTNTTLAALGAVLLGLMGLAFYLTYLSYQKRQRRQVPEFKAPPAPELIPPNHPYFGLWQHLFNYRNFTEKELQGIVQHCDRILLAKEHQEAVMLWERTMMGLVGEDSPDSVCKVVEKIRAERDEYFEASQAWATLMQLHFGTMVRADVKKAIRSMLEMEAKHTEELRRANERGDSNRKEMLEQSKLAVQMRQERDEAHAFANDLREYLDRSLALVKVQNEQIQQLMPKPKGWNLKAYPRDKHGRVMKLDNIEEEVPNAEAIIQHVADLKITPKPVKHLREVNAEIAEASKPTIEAFQQVHKAVARLGGTGEQYAWMNEGLQPAIETLKEHRERLGLKAEEFYEQPEPIEPRPDHPCLKGCSKPDGCFCRPGTPRTGRVYFEHDLAFFIGKGIIKKGDKNRLAILEWAQEKNLRYHGLKHHPIAGLREDVFEFSRPAVNSDFDVPNTNS